jgi:phosphoglycolate phosphatase
MARIGGTVRLLPKYEIVFLDLEGTLVDPGPGAVQAAQHALAQVGVNEESLYRLRRLIGPPLQDAFRLYYNLDELDALKAEERYRQHYLEYGILENRLYDGVEELLSSLQGNRVGLVALSSRHTTYLNQVLRQFGIYRFFAVTRGSSLGRALARKSDLMGAVLDELPVIKQKRLVIVGDREQDVSAGHDHSVDSIAVSYGYGSQEELRNADPTYTADSVGELSQLLLD